MTHISSKIFIDGGVAQETKQARDMLGYLDGQTTNPTLIAKNLKQKIEESDEALLLTEDMALGEYKKIVQEMSALIPKGSISIQVFANEKTTPDDMLSQARLRTSWIPNHSIKFPCTREGLSAAQRACEEMPINITLVFSLSQAAAVYEATKEAKYPVFISPFVGRLDDQGECGMDLIANIMELYKSGDGHVEVLTASIRNLEHVRQAIHLKSHILTIPFKVFQEWSLIGFEEPGERYFYERGQLKPLEYDSSIMLGKSWDSYDLSHSLTTKGVSSFWNDWMGLFNQR